MRSSILLVRPNFRESCGERRTQKYVNYTEQEDGSGQRDRSMMSSLWHEEEEEEEFKPFKPPRDTRRGSRLKPRFSFKEVKVLLEEVKRNRYILLKKFNHGVSPEAKKQTWSEITELINNMGENQREVRQIMKKWADLKCDGKRQMVAMRGPHSTSIRKKHLGPVERMVHKILLMTPGDENVDLSCVDGESPALGTPTPFSYLNSIDPKPLPLPGGTSFDLSPLSSPDKEPSGERLGSSPEFEFDLVDDEVAPGPFPVDPGLPRRPVHTYSRTNTVHHYPSRPPPTPTPPTPLHLSANGGPSQPRPAPARPIFSSLPSPAAPPPPSSSLPPRSFPPPSQRGPPSSMPPPPQPPPSFQGRWHEPRSANHQEALSRLAWQSVAQQQASRGLLGSVGRSLDGLARALQGLLETQRGWAQQSLLLQREALGLLRDFSCTTLAMLASPGPACSSAPGPPNSSMLAPPGPACSSTPGPPNSSMLASPGPACSSVPGPSNTSILPNTSFSGPASFPGPSSSSSPPTNTLLGLLAEKPVSSHAPPAPDTPADPPNHTQGSPPSFCPLQTPHASPRRQAPSPLRGPSPLIGHSPLQGPSPRIGPSPLPISCIGQGASPKEDGPSPMEL